MIIRVSDRISITFGNKIITLFFDNGNEVGERLAGGIKRSEIIKNLDNLLELEKVNKIKKEIKPTISEFDVVILYDVCAENYKNDFDRRLLYIACTRTLHQLNIYYTGEKSLLI